MSKKGGQVKIGSYEEYLQKYFPKLAKNMMKMELDTNEYGAIIARETLSQHSKVGDKKAS